jgi:citrate lyase gamma subunit
MATRMQQRRGTAAQWTAANPILAAGEIGFETDNNRFKIGNGATAWSALDYFANNAALEDLLDGAPEALNTLNELAAAIGDDADFIGTFNAHTTATTNVHGISDTNTLATLTDINTTASGAASALGEHTSSTTLVHGIVDTSLLATVSDVEAASNSASSALGIHEAATTNVHGIADTSELVTQEDLSNAVTAATVNQENLAGTGIDWNSDDERFDIDSTVATKTYADDAVTAHNDLTENVHGIADTSLLATQSYADDAEADAITAAGTAADTKISTAVAALTKSSVGLANVDNTSDADKPVSTATQTALDLKAPIAAPSFTGEANFESNVTIEGNLIVEGTTTTVNTSEVQIDDPLFYLSANQYDTNTRDIGITGAYGTVGGTEENHLHTGLVKDVTDGKWKLFSNTPHPVNNVVDFTSANYDTLKVGSLEATTVNPSSGVVFSDGTQTKEGVPSRTPIVQKTASYALSTLTHRDSMIEVSSTNATTITVPLDSTVDYPIGTTVDILQTNTGQVTVAGAAGVTVNATPGLKLRTRWSSATLMKRAANTWVVYGDLTA